PCRECPSECPAFSRGAVVRNSDKLPFEVIGGPGDRRIGLHCAVRAAHRLREDTRARAPGEARIPILRAGSNPDRMITFDASTLPIQTVSFASCFTYAANARFVSMLELTQPT